MKIDCKEIRQVVGRMEREGQAVDPVSAARGAELMRQKELTDAEVDRLWEILPSDPGPFPNPPDIGVREPIQPTGPTPLHGGVALEEDL